MSYIKIVNIIDKSGSMMSMKQSAIKGFNEFIESQQKLDGDVTVTTVLFSSGDDIQLICDNTNINDCIFLDDKNYQPNGGTALLDAIGDVINTEIDWLATIPLSERPNKTLCVILTDGDEIDSKYYNVNKIKNMISEMKTDYKWEFIFIGTDESSIFLADNIGISKGNSYSYTTNDSGISDAYQCISFATKSYRESPSVSMTDLTNTYKKEKDA